MHFNIKVLTLILILFFSKPIFSQVKIDNNFRSPIGIPITLSGNFGELRSNHFHTGIDIKTNGTINYKVYSIESGYVSRINISHWGYGKAIYIDHPNGYTSVYAHLDHFPEKIEKIIRKEQYNLKTETLTYYLDSLAIKVEEGEVIAYSGNTGGSSGPHLHFEIRETISEHPVNPQLFNFDISDNKSPVIEKLKLYLFDNKDFSPNFKEKYFNLIRKENQFILKYDSVITLNKGFFAFGLKAFDNYDNSNNKCGIYSIQMLVDGQLNHELFFDEIDFETNREINIHKDFKAYQNKREKTHKLFIHPKNDLQIYNRELGNGLLCFKDTLLHKIKILVKDLNNNSSELNFYVQNELPKSCDNYLENSKPFINKFYSLDSQMVITIDSTSLFDNVALEPVIKGDVYTFKNKIIPVKSNFILAIKLNDSQLNNADKLFIGYFKKNGNISNKNGFVSNGFISAELNSFRDYKIFLDNSPPIIKHAINNMQKNNNQELIFTITDSKSGVDVYNVFIDDNWVLSKYSHKNNKLKVQIDKYSNILPGKHRCRIEALDELKNKSFLEFEFLLN